MARRIASSEPALSRRERQIMDIVYARGRATVNDVLADLPDPPSRTAVRTLLRILEEKGHLKHTTADREYIYLPTRSRAAAGRTAFQRVLETFFNGSLDAAVAAHLADPDADLSPDDLERLAKLIRTAHREGDRS